MSRKRDLTVLEESGVDRWVTVIKASVSIIPDIGGPMAELIGSFIPNQRLDRVTKMIRELAESLEGIEVEVFKAKLRDEDTVDLLEEGIGQAARSTTHERRKYLASIIARSLSSDELRAQESKHLMRLLGQINDVEVIWLGSFLNSNLRSGSEYRKTHKHILQSRQLTMISTAQERNEAALQDGYKQHLSQLGLLKANYRANNDDQHLSSYGSGTSSRVKLANYSITGIGKLLLRELGFPMNEKD